MTYSLTNKCAKNYYNRELIVQVIAENVVTCFFFETQCMLQNVNVQLYTFTAVTQFINGAE